MYILGISAFYHDAAAALILNGEVIAAAQEERFTRIKHDDSFPVNAISYCLAGAGISMQQISAVVFYDKPFLKFERIIAQVIFDFPFSLSYFIRAIPVWLRKKISLKQEIKKQLKLIDVNVDKHLTILFSTHHLSHAASTFYASSFNNAAVLTIDGAGEWATAAIYKGEENKLTLIKELHFPHSLGLFYSTVTSYLGFKVNDGEYKIMGLAPYAVQYPSAVEDVLSKLRRMIVVQDDGAIILQPEYFNFSSQQKFYKLKSWQMQLGIAPREPGSTILHEHILLAAAVQIITEEVVSKMAEHALNITGCKQLCMAGGVALNAVANGKLAKQIGEENIFIQPASGDAGGALGAAWAAHYMHYHQSRTHASSHLIKWSKLGPSYTNTQINQVLTELNLPYEYYNDEELVSLLANHIVNGKVVGLFRGRMEFGPRALGARSIIASPMLPEMQQVLNLKIKNRESFRPFAPLVLADDVHLYFDTTIEHHYMLFVQPIKSSFQNKVSPTTSITEQLQQVRSPWPSITHVDYTARLQTISSEQDYFLYCLLLEIKKITGFGMLINTSFNRNDEPIVCSPKDAINCYLQTKMDILLLQNYMLVK